MRVYDCVSGRLPALLKTDFQQRAAILKALAKTLLARFDHPSLVKVYRFWEANGTAYMVMPYYEGVTLTTALRQLAAPPDETWLKKLLSQVLDALEVIHAERCYHRDIAPDNILMLPEGTPVLLDFGAARRVVGDASSAVASLGQAALGSRGGLGGAQAVQPHLRGGTDGGVGNFLRFWRTTKDRFFLFFSLSFFLAMGTVWMP